MSDYRQCLYLVGEFECVQPAVLGEDFCSYHMGKISGNSTIDFTHKEEITPYQRKLISGYRALKTELKTYHKPRYVNHYDPDDYNQLTQEETDREFIRIMETMKSNANYLHDQNSQVTIEVQKELHEHNRRLNEEKPSMRNMQTEGESSSDPIRKDVVSQTF